MTVSTLDVDRYISTLRLNSKSFSELSNEALAIMFEESIQNIKNIAYFWATIGADNKGIKDTIAEGEEWLGGPFASTIALQYYIEYLKTRWRPLSLTLMCLMVVVIMGLISLSMKRVRFKRGLLE